MNDERAAEGLDHLQAAALEMIQAARAFLDVAEDLVADREKVADAVHAFTSVAEMATQAARAKGVHGGGASADRSREDDQAGATGDDRQDDDGVQHIRVSS